MFLVFCPIELSFFRKNKDISRKPNSFSKVKFSDNLGHNVLELRNILEAFPFTANKAVIDILHRNIVAVLVVAFQPKPKNKKKLYLKKFLIFSEKESHTLNISYILEWRLIWPTIIVLCTIQLYEKFVILSLKKTVYNFMKNSLYFP